VHSPISVRTRYVPSSSPHYLTNEMLSQGYITELDLKRLQLPAASFEFLRDSMPQVEVELEGGEVEGGFNYEEFVAGLL
jgi:hypothetical protein